MLIRLSLVDWPDYSNGRQRYSCYHFHLDGATRDSSFFKLGGRRASRLGLGGRAGLPRPECRGEGCAGPKQVDESVFARNFLDRLFERSDHAAANAEYVEKLIPESLLFSAFALYPSPLLGKRYRTMADLIPRKGHGRIIAEVLLDPTTPVWLQRRGRNRSPHRPKRRVAHLIPASGSNRSPGRTSTPRVC